MTETGSDERFASYADIGAIGRGYRHERLRTLLEEWRLRNYPPEDDPGEDHPDPDQAPPADQEHPEYDPTPPQ